MQSRFDELVQKYFTVLDLAPELGVRIATVELRHGKLRIAGEAPSEEMKNRIWDRITAVDPTYPDLICQIAVNPSLPGARAPARRRPVTYTVQPGDTLESISRLFYGTGAASKKIRAANPEVTDPDRLEPGAILEIPV